MPSRHQGLFAAACLLAAAGLMATYLIQENWWWMEDFYVALVSAALLVCAAAPRRRAWGSLMVLSAALAVYPWLGLLHGWRTVGWNPSTWILFSLIPVDILFHANPPNVDAVELPVMKMAVWTVAATLGLALAVVLSLWRLLPERLNWRGLAWRDRTWPAFAFVIPLLLAWAIRDTIHHQGYRATGCYDPGTLAILHIEKNGQTVRATEVRLTRNLVDVLQSVRSAFQYKWTKRHSEYQMDVHRAAELQTLVAAMQSPAPKTLQAPQGEGWYVRLRPDRMLAFTTENGLQPPPAIVQFVRDSESALKIRSPTEGPEVDPCLGFCYDPLAVFFARF